MARRNIFEIMTDTFDLQTEISRLYKLSAKLKTISLYREIYTLRDFVAAEGFSTWHNRGHCLDLDDYLSTLNYGQLWESAYSDENSLLTLIEIIYNLWYIAENRINRSFGTIHGNVNYTLIKKLMDDCLAHYNYKALYFHDLEQLIVIENKPEATAVAEIADQNIGHKVLRYNHYMLKGDLHAKKDILLAMGADLEPKRKQLKEIDKDLEDSIFYILNNLNLRHNNESVGDKNYRQAVVDMDDDTLENWYDELYQMMLLAYLQLDQIERSSKVKALKQLVTPK